MDKKTYTALYMRPFRTASGEERTQSMIIGKAWESAKGGFDLVLHVMPPFLPGRDRNGDPDGSMSARIFVREQLDDRGEQGHQARREGPQNARRTSRAPARRDEPSFDPDEPPPGDDDLIPF